MSGRKAKIGLHAFSSPPNRVQIDVHLAARKFNDMSLRKKRAHALAKSLRGLCRIVQEVVEVVALVLWFRIREQLLDIVACLRNANTYTCGQREQ